MNNNRKKPVLYIVTSQKCGACKNYKQNTRDKLLPLIEDYVDVVEIDLPEMMFKERVGEHPGIAPYVRWYPTFILFDESYYNFSSPLNGIPYNGEYAQDERTKEYKWMPKITNGFDATSISTWVKEKAKDNSWRKNVSTKSMPTPILINNNGVPIIAANPTSPLNLRSLPTPGRMPVPSNYIPNGYIPTSGSNIRFAYARDEDDD